MHILLTAIVLLISCGPTALRPTSTSSLSDTDGTAAWRLAAMNHPVHPMRTIAASTRGLEAMFHPVDPTLERIAELIMEPFERIDIAMYNMEETDKSPVIAALESDEVQARIKAGELKVRVIFQGYDERQGPVSRILEEQLGVDVRHIIGTRGVHHKFGIFDGHEDDAIVVTGSANWSLSSHDRYDENLLFAYDLPGFAQAHQREFELLWNATTPFGHDLGIDPLAPEHETPIEEGLDVYFNSENFEFSPDAIRVPREKSKLYTLTRKLVAWIDRAESSLKIASTRINLRPVYDAIQRAAARGVAVSIVTNQDQYTWPTWRKKWTLNGCEPSATAAHQKACCTRDWDTVSGSYALRYDAYEKSCSTGQIHGYFLASEEYDGSDAVTVRVKLFNLHPNRQNSLSHQMHAKYTIIDDRYVLAGSFNYSVSAEYNHFENVVFVDGSVYPETVQSFVEHFASVFDQGRERVLEEDNGLLARLEAAHRTKTKTRCDLGTVALSYEEIDHLLDTRNRIAREERPEATWERLQDGCL